MDRPAVFVWGNRAGAPAELERAAAALAQGELIAIPTETVYGLAARADDATAVERLAALKGREREQPLTWHIGNSDALERLPRVSSMARRLIARYWPGPLTLVLPGSAKGVEAAARDGWTGVRFPAHAATAALLAHVDFPVVATSANRHGEPPASDAAQVVAAFGGELACVIDGGPARLGEGSVVLKLGPGHFELLRAGILDLGALRTAAGLRLGFVCTGNTCRSPMAEAIARARLAARLEVAPNKVAEFGFELASMGIFAGVSAPASGLAVEVLAGAGIDLSTHRSRAVIPEEIAGFDRIYTMTRGHLEALRLMLPPGRDQHCTLLDPEGRDIPDPIGGPRSEYEVAARQITRAVEARLDEWV